MGKISSLNRSDAIKWAITFILAAVFLFLPEQGVITHQVKLFLAITVFGLALAAFELVPLMFISISMPALWIFLGVAPAQTVMSSWVGSSMLMIIGALFMAATLEDCGLLKRIAFYLMCKVKGSYFTLLCSIMVITLLLNILSSGQGWLIMAPLATGLCMSMDGMNKKLGAGLAAAVMIGGCTSHAYTYQAASWALILQMGADYISPLDITPLSIIMHNWPLFVVSIVILFIVSKWFQPEEGLGDIVYFEENLKKMGSLTRREKVNALMMVILLVYIFTVKIHKLDLNLGFALIPWMVYLPFLEGADEKTVSKMNITTVFFIAACMSIGTVATGLGLGAAVVEVCKTFLGGSASPFLLMAIVFAVVFVLNLLMTPMAIDALLIAPICMLAVELGFSPIPFAYAVNACSEAILFPYEYMPYLILFSFGMMSMKDFIKFNAVRSVIFFAGYLFILVPYWMLIGIL